MSYRFNGGNGGVACDACGVLIDAGIGWCEYIETYGDGSDYCWRHKNVSESEMIDAMNGQQDKGK